MKIQILYRSSDGKEHKHDVIVEPKTEICEVIKEVSKRFESASEQKDLDLFSRGKKLKPQEKIEKYSDIKDGSVLLLVGKSASDNASINIKLRTLQPDKKFDFEYSPKETVKQMKDRIKKEKIIDNFDPETAKLLAKGTILQNGSILSKYSLVKDECVTIILPDISLLPAIDVSVTDWKGELNSINACLSETVLELKEKFAKIKQLSPLDAKKIIFLYRGSPLKDTKKLSDYGLKTNQQIRATFSLA